MVLQHASNDLLPFMMNSRTTRPICQRRLYNSSKLGRPNRRQANCESHALRLNVCRLQGYKRVRLGEHALSLWLLRKSRGSATSDASPARLFLGALLVEVLCLWKKNDDKRQNCKRGARSHHVRKQERVPGRVRQTKHVLKFGAVLLNASVCA